MPLVGIVQHGRLLHRLDLEELQIRQPSLAWAGGVLADPSQPPNLWSELRWSRYDGSGMAWATISAATATASRTSSSGGVWPEWVAALRRSMSRRW
jgi:hypothetical protein